MQAAMRRALLRRGRSGNTAFLKLKAMLPEIYAGCAERRNPDMAIFHYTIKIVGRSKGKSVISASAYLNGDVMKNEETGRISYYTSKKRSGLHHLMMCENAPPEWQIVPEENIKRFSKNLSGTKVQKIKLLLKELKIHFRNRGYMGQEVLRIEKNTDAQLERNGQTGTSCTTDYIQKTFVDDRGLS